MPRHQVSPAQGDGEHWVRAALQAPPPAGPAPPPTGPDKEHWVRAALQAPPPTSPAPPAQQQGQHAPSSSAWSVSATQPCLWVLAG